MDVRAYVEANAAGFFDALKQWLAIPSISGDPRHHGDVARSAQWLAAHLRQTGFPIVEIWPTGEPGAPGLPAVYAEWPAGESPAGESPAGESPAGESPAGEWPAGESPAGERPAPAVLVYGHHDVQPVEPLDAWDTDPFTPVERGQQLVGRGASDDKGQVLFHSLGVRARLAASPGGDAPPVTIKLLIEGEEESGSPNFAGLLRRERDRLACDVIVISDTTMWAADVPSMCTGLRGMVDGQIDLYGPESDLHSGNFGGAVPNPLHVLTSMLAALHDEQGRVRLPGFYDKVAPLSAAERELFGRLPYDEKQWLAQAGSRAAAGEAGYSTLERIWARPTAEINGMWGGHTGPGPKTIIPHEAHAKVSLRLVAHQEPAEVQAALREFVAAGTPPGIEARVSFSGPGVRPCLCDISAPATVAARRAMERAFGTQVLFTREGGSGPEADLADILGAPLVFLAVGLNSDRFHAPNERVQMPLLLKGAEAAAYLWEELAAVW